MTGDDLIALASHLVANTAFGSDEARYRSAVSRAYYGDFHLVVAFLHEVAAVRVVENHTGHQQAYRLLGSTNIPALSRAAEMLNELRSVRNQADYRLRYRGLDFRSNAVKWVEAALFVKSSLEACRTEPTRSEIELALKSNTGDAT